MTGPSMVLGAATIAEPIAGTELRQGMTAISAQLRGHPMAMRTTAVAGDPIQVVPRSIGTITAAAPVIGITPEVTEVAMATALATDTEGAAADTAATPAMALTKPVAEIPQLVLVEDMAAATKEEVAVVAVAATMATVVQRTVMTAATEMALTALAVMVGRWAPGAEIPAGRHTSDSTSVFLAVRAWPAQRAI